LGPIRFDIIDSFITLKKARKPGVERGFSLLIKKAGFYTLEGKLLGINYRCALCINVSTSAHLPLVFRMHREGDRISRGRHKRRFSYILGKTVRSECVVVITVCDTNGPLAFIGIARSGDIIKAGRNTEETGFFEVSLKRG
jgi:hypothetical protein